MDDLCVGRRRRWPSIDFLLRLDLASQAPSANVTVDLRRSIYQSRAVAVASGPPCFFLRAFGSKNGGSEATATSAKPRDSWFLPDEVSGGCPVLDQFNNSSGGGKVCRFAVLRDLP